MLPALQRPLLLPALCYLLSACRSHQAEVLQAHVPCAHQVSDPVQTMQMEFALPQTSLEAADLPAVTGESSSEEDCSEAGPNNGQLGLAFIQALSAQGLLPNAPPLHQDTAPPSTSSASFSEGGPAVEEYLELPQAGHSGHSAGGQEGPVDALARSMQVNLRLMTAVHALLA